MTRRLDALSDAERSFLEIVAISGRPVRVSLVDAAAAIKTSLVLRSDLTGKRLLRAVSTENVEIYHDRIREAVLASLSEERRRACHAQFAAALEHAGSEDPERLAYHHQRAGDVSSAVAHAIAAARRATAALAFSKATRCYEQALSLGVREPDERRAILTDLGDALTNAGRGADAARAYLRAADLASGNTHLQLSSLAAAQYLRSGHLPEGVQLFNAVLKRVGLRVPEGRRALLFRILVERVRLRASRRSIPTSGHRTAADYSEIDLCAAAAIGFSMVDPLRSSFFSTRFVRLASRLGEPRRLCLALAGEATQLCHSPRGIGADRVARLLGQARDLADTLGDPHARAFVPDDERNGRGSAGSVEACMRTSRRSHRASSTKVHRGRLGAQYRSHHWLFRPMCTR